MVNFKQNKPEGLPFVRSDETETNKIAKVVSKMLCVKLKKFLFLSMLMFVVSSVLFATDSYALFETLTQSGTEIFTGMREIIFAVSGFGIVAIAIGGFFGNLNWKWLSAIIIGLVVIATTAAIINYMVDSDVAVTTLKIQDTLIHAN